MSVLLSTLLGLSPIAASSALPTARYQVIATCAVSSTTDESFVGSVKRSSGGASNSRPQFYQIRKYETEKPTIRLYRKDWLDEWSAAFLVPTKYGDPLGVAAFDIFEEGELGGVFIGKISVWALDTKTPSLIESKVRLWREDAWSDLSSEFFHSPDRQKARVEKMNPAKGVIVGYAAGDCTENAVQNATSNWRQLSGEGERVGIEK